MFCLNKGCLLYYFRVSAPLGLTVGKSNTLIEGYKCCKLYLTKINRQIQTLPLCYKKTAYAQCRFS